MVPSANIPLLGNRDQPVPAIVPSASPTASRLSERCILYPAFPRGKLMLSNIPSNVSSGPHLCLLQPVEHVHLTVHRRGGGEVLLRLPLPVRTPIQLPETEVAVGDEGRISRASAMTSALW